MYLTFKLVEEANLDVFVDSSPTTWPIDVLHNGSLFMSLTIDEAKKLRDRLSIALADLAAKEPTNA